MKLVSTTNRKEDADMTDRNNTVIAQATLPDGSTLTLRELACSSEFAIHIETAHTRKFNELGLHGHYFRFQGLVEGSREKALVEAIERFTRRLNEHYSGLD